ncbi:hypothetical protein OG730_34815 [Streptomyces sp. NBC_01298]|uniref:hypothetical protein n=1 Tax=Streptomyces sp. NBC_01298 TaxID=2903817 RepID=UPI002E147908|nr:hypothetical protein OG730_34815 [Streptomyces sp. NBC_01298]
MTARPLAVGDVIHGFAYGAFGRDHYHCVRIEAVGPDWIVARDPDRDDEGWPSFTSGRRSLELCQQARDEPCPVDSPCPRGAPAPPLTTYGVTR